MLRSVPKGIVARLEGGLGNVMFQYALARHLSHVQDVPLTFDVRSFHTNPLGDYSHSLEPFGIDVRNRLATPEELAWFERRKRKPGRRWFLYNKLFSDTSRYVQEPHYHFASEVLTVRAPAYLSGWWQSEKYFAPIRDILLSDLTMDAPLTGKNAETAARMSVTDSISIHIRRCDYVRNSVTRNWFGELTKKYYDEALGRVIQDLSRPELFIFSDDVPWAEEFMRFPFPSTYVSWNTHDQGHEDLRLMSLAKHNVIANSTLGWWGAWLNQNPQKRVTAPAKWFRNAPKNNEADLVPPEWIKIPSHFAD